ncbi:MAG: hypothetical protein MJD61_05955 [Proteobacteria bacterium]|nr:hypothetical protein [Pseudomonadota bacterium]
MANGCRQPRTGGLRGTHRRERRARLCGLAALMVLGPLVSGCLVTSELSFEEHNFPPVLADDPSGETPIGHIIVVDEAAKETVLRAQLMDRNAQQPWVSFWRYRTLLRRGPGFDDLTLPWSLGPGGISPRDNAPQSFELAVGHALLGSETAGSFGGQCYRVDVIVSSDFAAGSTPMPALPDDIARASWWLWKVNAATRKVDPETCPRETVGLGP